MPTCQARAELWGDPGGPSRAHLIVTSPRPCKAPPSRQRLLPSRPEAWGRAIQSPWATAQSVHREAASSSAFVSARPTRPGVRPRSATALRIQDSAEGAFFPVQIVGAECQTPGPQPVARARITRGGWSAGGDAASRTRQEIPAPGRPRRGTRSSRRSPARVAVDRGSRRKPEPREGQGIKWAVMRTGSMALRPCGRSGCRTRARYGRGCRTRYPCGARDGP
jgi:hypothetical protein